MEVIAGEGEQGEEGGGSSSGSSGSRCPHCRTLYASPTPQKCEHLLCEMYYAESNNDLVEASNSSITAIVCGIEIPRAIAMRFLRFARETSTQGDSVTETNKRIATIKYSIENGDSFREWTYFLTSRPRAYATLLESFVSKMYCDNLLPRRMVPFSCLRVEGDIVMLASDTLTSAPNNNGTTYSSNNNTPRWLMLSSLPDNLPVFLFPMETNIGGKYAYFGRSEELLRRTETWAVLPSSCTVSHLAILPSYLIS